MPTTSPTGTTGGAHATEVSAWKVIAACAEGDGLLRAAAQSSLYPHVWTRDVGLASLGILAKRRTDADAEPVLRSLEAIAKAQTSLGRMPLKIDPRTGKEVQENSAGVDAGLWFAVAVAALARTVGREKVAHLVLPAIRGVGWCAHLDQNGDELLETPEASDWADMMPHRHAVLFVNVLFVEAIRSLAAITDGEVSEGFEAWAHRVRTAVRTVFAVRSLSNAASVGAHLAKAEALNPEFALTLQYATRHGDLPFLLPYVAHRAVGTHCDVVGNLLAVLAGVLEGDEANRFLDYLAAVGAADPAPTKTIYPPIQPGSPDWRDHFHWRNLNLPDHYQNGGSWPFAGALHVAALVRVGRDGEAKNMLARLEAACAPGSGASFPEWQHGRTGASMGEVGQLWSAAGLLFARVSVESRSVPFLGDGASDMRDAAP